MIFRKKLQYFLVKKLDISNKQAGELINSGNLKLNGNIIKENCLLTDEDELSLKNEIIKKKKIFYYVVFYKPIGIETTLNNTIENNLNTVFKYEEKLFPVGRLDKASEGLLLLTNDGRIMNRVSGGWFDKEKEYVVCVDKKITHEFIEAMTKGIQILGKITRPAIVKQVDDFDFTIILTEGMNRQIRRMCYKQGYEVLNLKRVRIMNIKLGDLKSGEQRMLSEKEKNELFTQLIPNRTVN